jgi:hypothetical protein
MSGVYRSENNNQYATGYAPIRLFNRLCAGNPIPAANCPESQIAFLPNLTSAKNTPSSAQPVVVGYYDPVSRIGPSAQAQASAALPGSRGSSSISF